MARDKTVPGGRTSGDTHRLRPRRQTLATLRPVAGPDVSPDTFAA
jgi:hypothetical protein